MMVPNVMVAGALFDGKVFAGRVVVDKVHAVGVIAGVIVVVQYLWV